ncbi:hypothetical protein [Myroides sp. TSA_177.3]|uniref:hypothetical protein n=1 Tax=Myroides sp. TSA_177.3 TaxID=3415650 RepID=UPI004045DEF8
MAIYQQKKTKGGHWSGTTTLPTIIIPPGGPDPSFYWSWGDFSFSDPGFSYGGGGGGIGGGDSDYPTNQGDINDPHNMMDFTENYLKDNLEAIKNLIDNGAIDPIKGKALMDAYQKGLDILDRLRDSDKNYRFDVNPDYHEPGKNPKGGTSYDPNTNEYVVTIPGTPSQYLGLLMHELEHLNQIENGELSFDKNGNFADYDVMDEVNAYQFQEYIEQGTGYKTITPDDVLNMTEINDEGEVEYIYKEFRTSSTGNNNGGGGFVIVDYSSFSRS